MSSSEPVVRMDIRGPVERRLTSARHGPVHLAALIDPDNFDRATAAKVAVDAERMGFECILVGGSTLGDQGHLDNVVRAIKRHVACPVILFPGNVTGISRYADAILFTSLLNSMNPYFIIGAQAIGAAQVNRHRLEAIPMGYLVFGDESTTSFIGQVRSIPYSKPAIAVMYALAAQYLGMRTLYLEAGSGSSRPMPPELVKAVRKYFTGFLVVGGGITSPETALALASAGADLLVVGNLFESEDYREKVNLIAAALRDKLKG